jgi:hypothetical protein
MVVAEVAAHQAVAMRQEESIDVATVGSTPDVPFLRPYRASADLIALANDVVMAEAYVVGMVVP